MKTICNDCGARNVGMGRCVECGSIRVVMWGLVAGMLGDSWVDAYDGMLNFDKEEWEDG